MTPTAIANTGYKIYILFILMTVLSFPFVYFFLPEVSPAPNSSITVIALTCGPFQTRGKSLEEIDYLFATGDAKARLEQRFHDAAARAHDRAEVKTEHELDEVEATKA